MWNRYRFGRWQGFLLAQFSILNLILGPNLIPSVHAAGEIVTAPQDVLNYLNSGSGGSSFASNYVTMVGSCFNPTNVALGAMGSAMGGTALGVGGNNSMSGMASGLGCGAMGAISITSACPGSDEVPTLGTMDCSTASPAMVQQTEQLLKMTYCTLQCKKAKADVIQAELSCLQSLGQKVNAQAATLGGLFQQASQIAQQRAQGYQLAFDDDQAKLLQVGNLLNGDEGGAGGLLQMQKETQDELARMPQELLQMQNAYKDSQQQQKTLNSFIQSRTSGLMMDCFAKRPVANFRCIPNGPTVSASEYVACRYKQSQSVGRNGLIEQNNLITGKAEAGANALSSLLEQMSTDGNGNGTKDVPTDPDQMLSQGNTSGQAMIASPADVDRLYGGQLAQFRIGNTSARDFVMQTMQSCYSRATNQVNAEKSNAGSAIGVSLNKIQTNVNDVNRQITESYQKLSQRYTGIQGALRGENMQLNAPACVSGPTQSRINCLQNARNAIQGLLTGSAADSRNVITLSGNNAAKAIPIPCSGLSGCISALQKNKRSLVSHQQQVFAERQSYILTQNQGMETFAKMLGAQLSGASMMINKQLSDLNLALASIGGSPMTPQPLRGEQLQPDQFGLHRPPQNPLNFIAQFVSPPLPDLSNQSFMGGVGSSVQNVNSRMAQASSQLMQIQTLWPKCEAERKRTILESLNQINPQGCHDTDLCLDEKVKYEGAINEINLALGQNYMLQGSLSQLRSGIASACENRVGNSQIQGALEELWGDRPIDRSSAEWKKHEKDHYKQAMNNASRYNNSGSKQNCEAYMGALMGAKGSLGLPSSSNSSGQNTSTGARSRSK